MTLGGETVVRRIRRGPTGVRFEPDNEAFEAIDVDVSARGPSVRGRVVALFRWLR